MSDVWEKQMEFYLKLTESYNSDKLIEDFSFMLRVLEAGEYKKRLKIIIWNMQFWGIWPFRNLKVEKKDWKHVDFAEIAERARRFKKVLQKEEKYAPKPIKSFLKFLEDTCKYIIKLNDNIHHCICEELFHETLRGEEVFVYIDNYDVIRNDNRESVDYMTSFMNAADEIGETVEYLHCSVVSKDMLIYDKRMFNIFLETPEEDRDKAMKSYKPYFSEFVIPVDQNGRAKGKYNVSDELESITAEDGWFIAKFVPNDSEIEDNSSYVEGGMLTFASPPDYTKGKLLFKSRLGKEEKTYIESAYSRIVSCTDIEPLLKLYASDICNASVYNIGHGNFVTLENAIGDTKVVYDIGLPYIFQVSKAFNVIKKNYKKAYNKMVNLSTQMVIISHWDCDHYLGAYCNNMNIFEVPWITTFSEKVGYVNAKRIMAYLSCNKKLYALDRNIDPQLVGEYSASDYVFQLYRGKGTSYPITPMNCQGLSVRVENKDVLTLMCGDIPYDCLPDTIVNGQNYEYVIIPHHASNMSPRSLNALDSMNEIQYPIICADGDEELGKTKKKVKAGNHCTLISKKSHGQLFFTDDATHSKVTKYECNLSARKAMATI